jgi:dihydroorotase
VLVLVLLTPQAGALSNLEAFASFNGPDFYGLPRNKARGCPNGR